LRIILYDEHELVCLGLKHYFSLRRGFELAAGSSLLDLTEDSAAQNADVLVFGTQSEIQAEGQGDLEVARHFCQRTAHCRLLVFGQNAADAGPALKSGARGFVLKSEPLWLLEEGVREVGGGGMFVSPSLVAQYYREKTPRGTRKENPYSLTRRETEILKSIALGNSNKEVAAAFGISARTAEAHRSHIIRKLGIRSAAELAIFALKYGLIEA